MAYQDRQVYNPTEHQGDDRDPYVANATSNPQEQSQLSDVDARQYVLDRIASGEANSYNELYGGKTFQGYDSHPDVHIPIPGRPGWTTSAAGRYQFITPTWNDEAIRLGLKDFSPQNQDAAAWDLAQRTYQQTTGRNLVDDAKKRNVNWSAMGGQWPSLAGPSKSQTEHPTPYQRNGSFPPAPQQGTASPNADNGQMKKLMALMMLQSSLNNMRLQPVDYNPFLAVPHFLGATM